MEHLFDLCGMPIQLKKIKAFRLVKRDYLFCPAYQEIDQPNNHGIARLVSTNKHSFRFVKMIPYGAILNETETPVGSSYEIKGFSDSAILGGQDCKTKKSCFSLFRRKNLSQSAHDRTENQRNFLHFKHKRQTGYVLTEMGHAIGKVANVAADILQIDTSGNQEFRVITRGHHLTKVKLRDIPAKVVFLSGKSSDVYKYDANYKLLGEPISPIIDTVSTLVITVDKNTYVFFGGGIDLDDADSTYHMLLEIYNNHHSKKNLTPFPKFHVSIPRRVEKTSILQKPDVLRVTSTSGHAALPKDTSSCSQTTNE